MRQCLGRVDDTPWAVVRHSDGGIYGLQVAVSVSKCHAALSDGLADGSNELSHTVHLLLLKSGVFYISLSTDAHRIQPQISAMQQRRVDGVYFSGGI